jgi:hypothetical protein
MREQLVAAIEAAPELPRDSRQHLADVFLDQLHAEYDLVPRGSRGVSRPASLPGPSWFRQHWVPIALVIGFFVFVLPVITHVHFVAFVLFLTVVFFIVRRVRSRRMAASASQ